MPPTAGSVVEVLGALARALQKLRVPWYVFGAQALVLRGSPRATADLDVTVILGKLPTARLVDALASAGFEPQFASADFVATTRVLPVFHTKSRFPVDLVLGGPGLEEAFANAAQPIRVGRRDIPVATSTHLTLMKVLAARPKDLEDAVTLLTTQWNEIDHRELDGLAKDLASALDDTDVLKHLTEVRQRAKRLMRASTIRSSAAPLEAKRRPKKKR